MKRLSLAARLWWTIRSQWQVMAAVLPGVALALAHSTMLVVPKADVIDALDSDQYRIYWISGSFQLGSALGMALTRFVGSRLGLRRAYLLGVMLFMLAGSACGLVNEVIWMTPLRFVEGLGYGLLISVAMVIIWRAFPRQREFAMAAYGMAIFVPAVAGVVMGGLLTWWESWRLIFLINLPLGTIVFLLAWTLLPNDAKEMRALATGERSEPRGTSQKVTLDYLGLALLAGTIVSLNVMLDLGQYWGWATSRHFVSWLAAFLICFGAFVARGIWARQPLISLHVFSHRNTTLGLLVKIVFSINLYVLLALLATYMINLRGYQWWQEALVILPAVGTIIASILAGVTFGQPRNNRLRMFAGLCVMMLATWQLTVLDLYTSKFWLAAVLGAWGLGAGLVIGPALFTIFADLPPDETMTLAGVFNIFRTVPAYIATVTLVTLWTQTTDAQFDTLRQNVRYNRPVVSESYRSAQQHAVAKGSPRDESVKQSQALIGQWTHANSRTFALQEVMRYLVLLTAPGLVFVLLMRQADAPVQAVARRAMATY